MCVHTHGVCVRAYSRRVCACVLAAVAVKLMVDMCIYMCVCAHTQFKGESLSWSMVSVCVEHPSSTIVTPPPVHIQLKMTTSLRLKS